MPYRYITNKVYLNLAYSTHGHAHTHTAADLCTNVMEHSNSLTIR